MMTTVPMLRGMVSRSVATATGTRNLVPIAHQRLLQQRPYSQRKKTPINTGVNFVSQQEAWVVERFGKFKEILEPGLRFLIPIIDEIKYVHSLKELVIEIPSQSAITQDNVTLHLDGVLYLRVVDPFKASYGVEDPHYSVAQLAQTTMRSELGTLTLDTVFKERQTLNVAIVDAINQAAEPWGLTCLRCEIRDIMLPDRVVEDMQRQVSAERKKRAAILESEGTQQATINVAEGKKRSVILSSEADMAKKGNLAKGEADAIVFKADATAKAIRTVAEAIQSEGGQDAVALTIAKEYIEAFGNIAKETNTTLLPANLSDPASMIAQASTIFNNVKTMNADHVAKMIVEKKN
eukprot:m.8882 g.8882  ORF g.8882 m.8882 type:complete len:350 (-) comp3290_c0_seq1:194-1243(-)